MDKATTSTSTTAIDKDKMISGDRDEAMDKDKATISTIAKDKAIDKAIAKDTDKDNYNYS